MKNFKKVIIWGYPLYSHTHSFVHYGWYKAFKSLGYDTYWFSDNNYPVDFNYSDCIFVTEGYADSKIPLVSSSVYFVHICKEPAKYLNAGCRVIDIRFNVKKTKDFSYNYTRPDDKLIKLDDCTLYEANADDSALVEKYRQGVSGYEALYMIWATDLIPNEINFENAFKERTNKIYYIGSFWSANRKELLEFGSSLGKYDLSLEVRNPWTIRTTNEEAIQLVQDSYIAPDIRGSGATCDGATAEECNHLSIGYIPCRIFKNISYGQLGITNSEAVKNLMGDYVIYEPSPFNIVEAAEPYRKDYDKIIASMDYVKNNHTFVNRINALLKAYEF